MESGKQGGASSETSSDGSEQVNHDRAAATKRSYECTYCKRGFTNAQALGGHMNIHRKDRAKAKQPSVDRHKNSNNHRVDHEFVSSNNGNNFAVPSFLPLSGHHHLTSWYVKPAIDHDHDHGSVYFHPGPSIPSTLPFGYASYEATPNHGSSAMSNEELMGADLSLQIECDEHDGMSRVSRGMVDEDVLDLELRLGYR